MQYSWNGLAGQTTCQSRVHAKTVSRSFDYAAGAFRLARHRQAKTRSAGAAPPIGFRFFALASNRASYSSLRAARNASSCSLLRFVEMISNFWPLTTSASLSITAPLVSRNSAEVPSVTFSRVCLMKLSSMP